MDFTSINTAETIFGGNNVTTDAFDPSDFNGFAAGDFNTITTAVLAGVINDYRAYPTVGADGSSPLANGQELDIDFEIGSVFNAPSNGDASYYFMKVGERNAVSSSVGFLGHACGGCVSGFTVGNGTLVGSILTDVISTISHASGNLAEVANLLIGTISHEIGHTLSLNHAGMVANPGDSTYSIMGTGAQGMPNNQRILDRAFSYTDFATLVNVVGTRDVTAVPLPASVYLFGFSMALLGFMQRRKKSA
ncbi:MAG: hypothetical protein AB8D52_08565 [Gammaproteobacteria bacterium]